MARRSKLHAAGAPCAERGSYGWGFSFGLAVVAWYLIAWAVMSTIAAL